MNKNRNTEQDIINAARILFLKKGYKATSVREIVVKANANNSMLHYYFRSKENLLNIIFDETFRLVYSRVTKILLKEDLDIFEKIQLAVSDYIQFFNDNPQIPIFIAGEVNRSPEKVGERIKGLIKPNFTNEFNKQLQKEYQKGTIRNLSGDSLLVYILSLCVFPVIAKTVLNHAIGVNSIATVSSTNVQQQEITNFIIKAIKSESSIK